jgi:hypothetical protein
MRSHVQPGLVAGADPTRFVSKHWGWLRALLILCLLFAVGAAETEAVRFQARQSKRPIRSRQWRQSHAVRRAASHVAIDAASTDSWEATAVALAWDGRLLSDPSTPHRRTVGAFQTARPVAPRLVALDTEQPAPPPGSAFPPGIRIDSSRAPPFSIL